MSGKTFLVVDLDEERGGVYLLNDVTPGIERLLRAEEKSRRLYVGYCDSKNEEEGAILSDDDREALDDYMDAHDKGKKTSGGWVIVDKSASGGWVVLDKTEVIIWGGWGTGPRPTRWKD